VITSAQPAEQAATGAFPRLLRDAIHALPTAGYNPAALPLDSIVKAMNTSEDKPCHQTIGHTVAGLTGEIPPFLPNPRHDRRMTEVDLAIQHASEFDVQAEHRDTELRTRLLVRAMGGSSNGTGGWWFAGRHTALLDITAWLHHPDPSRPLQVVTGNPGSGKTAVLGLIAALTHPLRRATVPLPALGLPAAAVPDPQAVDIAIYAQSLTTDQVLAGIAAAVRSRAGTPGQLLEELIGRATPLTVLVDAIDEATDPDHLIGRLLRPLADHAACSIAYRSSSTRLCSCSFRSVNCTWFSTVRCDSTSRSAICRGQALRDRAQDVGLALGQPRRFGAFGRSIGHPPVLAEHQPGDIVQVGYDEAEPLIPGRELLTSARDCCPACSSKTVHASSTNAAALRHGTDQGRLLCGLAN
jgi:hypothetical protein